MDLVKKHGMRIAGGQEPMKGKLFRLGHMGHYTDDDISDLVSALLAVLVELGWTEEKDALEAAEQALAQSEDEASSTGPPA